jgi:hypothetical protein
MPLKNQHKFEQLYLNRLTAKTQHSSGRMSRLNQSRNPHSVQSQNPRTDIAFERVLQPTAPMLPYHSRTAADKKTVIHWGQRKLLMSEIEFLLLQTARGQNCTVIYAGAAPGTHVNILSKMFPEHRFVLVDPAPFTVQEDGRHIIIKQCMFTDELANELKEEYAGERLLFVSDVRSADYEQLSQEENAECIKKDMDAQANWHAILQPQMSMLKFRLPYTPGTTAYLKGEIFLPVWGPQSTTECRLVVGADAGYEVYDHTDHEQRMFFFNTVTRPALYNHGVRGCGIDGCYDCTAEVGILGTYLGPHATKLGIAGLSADISHSIAHDQRTLASPNVDREVRRRVIRKNQWIRGKPAYVAAPTNN